MADTLPNTVLPPQQWVDLYAATGIPVGTKICVQNIGCFEAFLVTQEDEPVLYENHRILVRAEQATNEKGDSGAWALSMIGTTLNVKVVK